MSKRYFDDQELLRVRSLGRRADWGGSAEPDWEKFHTGGFETSQRFIRTLRTLILGGAFDAAEAAALPFLEGLLDQDAHAITSLLEHLVAHSSAPFAQATRPAPDVRKDDDLTDARLAPLHRLNGGRGDHTRVGLVEWGWGFSSAQLVKRRWRALGPGSARGRHERHGCRTLTRLSGAARDGGVAPGLGDGVVASPYGRTGRDGTPIAMLEVLELLRPGDVLLLEVQAKWRPQCFAPIEVNALVHAMTRLATALGVLVVEPTGNCGRTCDLTEDSAQ